MKMRKYIDTEELLKQLNYCKYPALKTTKRQAIYNAAISDACRIVDVAPAADVQEVLHGHWTNLKISISGDSSAECSLCGAVVHDNFSNVINYCPNCGADMRGK